MTVESAPPNHSSAADALPDASRRQERARPAVFRKYEQKHETVLHLITHVALDRELTRC